MAAYVFDSANRSSGKDKFDVEEFNRVASTYPPIGYSTVVIFSNNDTAIYNDNDWPTDRLYLYNNLLWTLNVTPNDFDDLVTGLAITFRETLNDNFSQIKDQADTVEKNLDAFRTKLKTIATSASAADLITDSNHRTVTDAEKNKWNERGIYQGSDPITGQGQIYYESGTSTTNITNSLSAYVNESIPQTTSDLVNEDGLCILVQKDQYNRPACFHWQLNNNNVTYNSTTKIATFTNPAITSQYVPYIMFSDAMLATGAFSTCESQEGKVVFSSSSPIPDNFSADLYITYPYNPFSDTVQ